MNRSTAEQPVVDADRHAGVTIATVAFRCLALLKLNVWLTSRLNPQTPVQWLIAENSPPEEPNRAAVGEFGDMRVLPRVEPDPSHPRVGSDHHARALMSLLPHVRTRYLLTLDPDFYALQPDWLTQMIRHMQEHDLAFFGVPWHPRWRKYRYFPCVHCMLIDLERVPVDRLDFRASAAVRPAKEQQSQAEENARRPDRLKRWLGEARAHQMRTIIHLLRGGSLVRESPDTGHEIYRQYGDDPLRKSQTIPVVYQPTDWELRGPLGLAIRCIDRCKPPRRRFLPSRPGYVTRRDFRRRGYIDAQNMGFEEFIWNDKPFAVHIRQWRHAEPVTVDRAVEVVSSLTGLDAPSLEHQPPMRAGEGK